MADRIAILSNGVMQQVGTAEELLTAPANTFVAGFLGAPPINLIEGVLSTHDGGLYFVAEGFSVPLAEAWYHRLNGYNNDRVIAGIRPASLTLSSGSGAIFGEVAFVELLLGEIVVGVQVNERTMITASLVDTVPINEGERIALDVDSEQLLLFDPETTRAIG
ncbi:MAG: ABC transporter ATP-binding protein [Anaerolinea sp.]|nr:ABC transporter ATP-binding protein [Anaerolinea sp.]